MAAMSRLIVFVPKAELDANGNLRGFIDACRTQLTAFGANLPFSSDVWDITDSLSLKGHGNKRQRLIFSKHCPNKTETPKLMDEPFRSFSKAYLRYMHGLRPTKAIAGRLAALRLVEAALSEVNPEAGFSAIGSHILNRAAQLAIDHYSDGLAYRIGSQIEMLSKFLSDNRLIRIPMRWRNWIKRPGDTDRVGTEFDERRAEKLPSEAALTALPRIFRIAKEPCDIIVTSVTAILFCAPSRISEVLMMPLDCEAKQSDAKNNEDYGLRWWPAKGGNPMVKFIKGLWIEVAQEAVANIRALTHPARQIACWYEDHPQNIFLPEELEHLRHRELLHLSDIAEIIGLSGRDAAWAWCKQETIPSAKRNQRLYFRFVDVQTAVIRMLPQGFPILNPENGLKYKDALIVILRNQMHPKRGSYRCMIEPVSINAINSALGTHVSQGFDSLFSRFGFTEHDGAPIKITTHQIRHYLDTVAQGSGLISQLDVALWAGRKDISQNAAYDHVTPERMLEMAREAIGDGSTMFGPLSKTSSLKLVTRDTFAKLKFPTMHHTDIGGCGHDWTTLPCQNHRDCINCEDLVCIKGDTEKTDQIQRNLRDALALVRTAEDAVTEGYFGSDRWLDHHRATVDRLTQLANIMLDPRVPVGAVIQLSPPRLDPQITSSQMTLIAPADKALPLSISGIPIFRGGKNQ
jgi:hypothetical protein